MQKLSTKHLGVVLVVLAVALAGCSGGNESSAETTTVGDGGSAATETTTAPPTTAEPTGGTTTTTEPATEVTTTAPATTTAPPTTEMSTQSGPWSVDQHLAAMREAGSFTVELQVETHRGGSLVATEKVNLETGERYSTQTSVTSKGNFTSEFYLPPNSDTAYQYRKAFNETSEVSAKRAKATNLSNLGTREGWPDFRKVGSGETELGSATVYVVTDVDKMAPETRRQYDDIKSFEWRIWVDDDTGAIAKYDYRIEYGDDKFLDVRVELTDLGSTTVEKPDWVPDDSS